MHLLLALIVLLYGVRFQYSSIYITVRVERAHSVCEGDDAVSFDAIDMLNALMEPMHDEYDLSQEQLNKRSILSTKKFVQGLFDIFTGHIVC